MLKVNKKEGEIKISIPGDVSDLICMQNALSELMKHYNFKDFGSGANATFYYGMILFNALLPDEDQQMKSLEA